MRILHLADAHLDTSFAGRSPRIRGHLREATRQAFRNATEVAVTERVDAVVIAGDLFDSSRLSFETEGFLAEQLGRLSDAGITVVYATGNHDPGSTGRERRTLHWPSGVTVVADAAPRRIPVRDEAGEILGWITAAGHASARETRDLAAAFPEVEGALPEVAVLHTQVVGSRGADAHDPYAPTTLETLARPGYDYWALGHVHTRQALSELPGVHYSGNLQGRTLRETGPKGALLVEVVRGFASQVEFRPLAPVRWEDLDVSGIDRATTLDGLLRLVGDAWQEARRRDPDPGVDWMVRVSLSGPTPLWKELLVGENRAHLAAELEELLGALEVTVAAPSVHAPVVVAEHRSREDVLGLSLRLAERLRSGTGELPGIADELAALPEGTSVEDYLVGLMRDVDGELASRLLKRDEP